MRLHERKKILFVLAAFFGIAFLCVCGCRQQSRTVVGTWTYPTPDDGLVLGEQHYSQSITFKANNEFELKEIYLSTGRSFVGKYTLSDKIIEMEFTGHGNELLKGMRIGALPTSGPLRFRYYQKNATVLELLPIWSEATVSDSKFVSPCPT